MPYLERNWLREWKHSHIVVVVAVFFIEVLKVLVRLGAEVCRSIEMLSQALEPAVQAPLKIIYCIKTQCKLHLRKLNVCIPSSMAYKANKIQVETFIINNRYRK